MSLWLHWWNAIWRLRPAFSRLQTFLSSPPQWQVSPCGRTCWACTSIVRALNLNARYYNALVDHFHSAAVKLDQLTGAMDPIGGVAPVPAAPAHQWAPCPLSVTASRSQSAAVKCRRSNDSINNPESNTKPEYIMGHSLQAVSILVHAAASLFAVPLAIRIHEGLVWTNRDRRTLLDKMLALLGIVAITEPCYFVADAYYAAHKIVAGLLRQNNHLVTRMKSNAVAYTAHHQRGPRKRGRPRIYGRKISLSFARCWMTPRASSTPPVPSTARTR